MVQIRIFQKHFKFRSIVNRVRDHRKDDRKRGDRFDDIEHFINSDLTFFTSVKVITRSQVNKIYILCLRKLVQFLFMTIKYELLSLFIFEHSPKLSTEYFTIRRTFSLSLK